MSRTELIRIIRMRDLWNVTPEELAEWCRGLGQSHQGTRRELIRRIQHEVWSHANRRPYS